jgi:hypothetical protein
MTVGIVEKKVVFYSLIDDISKQLKNVPNLTELEVADQFFSEKHEVALRFNRLHTSVMQGGFSLWREHGYMKRDYEILFEHIERGYAQGIKGFHGLLSIFSFIRDLGSPENFRLSQWVKDDCPDCEGTGGTYVSGKCSTCDGKGRVPEENIIQGEGEEEYKNVLNIFNEKYHLLSEKDKIQSYEEYINRLEEVDVDIEKAVEVHKNNQKLKPDCKLIGEDGNVFNLMAIVYRTLKREGMKDRGEEMQNRVWASQSYAEALSIFSDYVDIC